MSDNRDELSPEEEKELRRKLERHEAVQASKNADAAKATKKPRKKRWRYVFLALVAFVIYAVATAEPPTPEELAAREAAAAEREAERAAERAAEVLADAEERSKGFHCLSSWDGSHRDFRDAVKSMMRAPDSFEHIETRVTPVANDGTHTILMEYRAQNGFGGMNVATAVGTYRNSDCRATVVAVQ